LRRRRARLFEAPPGETVNDADQCVANFYRAVKFDCKGVAHYADDPVNETDVRAWRRWLADQAVFRKMMLTDPEYYDIRIAGKFCWMMGLNIAQGTGNSKPKNNPNGIHGLEFRKNFFRNFEDLRNRLRYTRVLCDDWQRVLTPVETTGSGLTAVFLDPPYADNEYVYDVQTVGVSHAVREWAIAHGDDPLFRIALCGYREHDMPEGWTAFDWKAAGGYGNQGEGRGRENAELERIWFSRHCVDPSKGNYIFA